MYFYSGLNRAFYSSEVHSPEEIPAGAVEISEEHYQQLLSDQSAGKEIAPNALGQPFTRAREVSLEDLRLSKQSEIKNKADKLLQAMAIEYGAMEKLTWDQQAAEADALAADSNAPAPLVRSIAAARGMSALELATRIQASRAQWVVLSGHIVGQRLAYQDQLDAAQTVEQVAAIVPAYRLP